MITWSTWQHSRNILRRLFFPDNPDIKFLLFFYAVIERKVRDRMIGKINDWLYPSALKFANLFWLSHGDGFPMITSEIHLKHSLLVPSRLSRSFSLLHLPWLTFYTNSQTFILITDSFLPSATGSPNANIARTASPLVHPSCGRFLQSLHFPKKPVKFVISHGETAKGSGLVLPFCEL